MAALCKCYRYYYYWLPWGVLEGTSPSSSKTLNEYFLCVCECVCMCVVLLPSWVWWIQVAFSARFQPGQLLVWFIHACRWITFLRTVSVTGLPPSRYLGIKSKGLGVCGWILLFLSFLLMVITFPISIWMCLKVIPWETDWSLCVSWWTINTKCSPFISQIIKEYERAVVFRLGRIQADKAKGPGITLVSLNYHQV